MNPARFRWLLLVVFAGLAVPAAILIRHAFTQLELDAFRREQLAAEQIYRRIDGELTTAIGIEQARGIDEYRFAAAAAARVQRSPLSTYPPAGALPGTVGYFEVDRAGRLTTPLLPPDAGAAGFSAAERAARRAVEGRIATVLAENRLLGTRAASPAAAQLDGAERRALDATERREAAGDPAERQVLAETAPETAAGGARGQAAFDELATTAGPVRATRPFRSSDDAGALEQIVVTGARVAAPEADAETEEAPSLDAATADDADAADAARARPADADSPTPAVATFEVDAEPFRFSRLDPDHFVLFRNAWRGGQRYVQGVLLEADELLARAIGDAFAESTLARDTVLAVSAGADVLRRLESTPADGGAARRPLFAARLSPPLAELELAFAAGDLPHGPAYTVLVWTAVTLVVVLVGGFLVVYRFGAQQIALAHQQQDFVSAVSHELKTPLTSIRMYGEMLKSGWAGEDKKQAYYEFIYTEGERLSRLIDNVLELARLSRGGPAVAPEAIRVSEILDMIRSKVATQAEQAGVALTVDADAGLREASVSADADALAQVFINLVDNAIKFARDAERHEIVLTARADGRERVAFGVRDFGPGIPAAEMKRLFRLFYRPDNELTRTTAGTGLGLALVKQLVAAMNGSVDVVNLNPGAEFRITLPIAPDRT